MVEDRDGYRLPVVQALQVFGVLELLGGVILLFAVNKTTVASGFTFAGGAFT